ncbi:MAG: DegT/DnrJ/EryC1/StrS family aminotransferase [Gammaproteobacteria bacterium]|jgi:CDP-6-deoxy-D-xylo-4-hexulose-3-dehydrase|nr:DegT/DnrJ/EryC1/StrS family aminotransferase [Gammaproteobacteria bacterium]MBP6050198.1 DegT/DnrJ/EryC1/StrS family aminotransferase [Pseudomonadales bacterium]MBK6583881.1 DegT/DnrJ/EryC1/StrS family aminotransferase [Gammaproteobacteria bacterium]MBK7522216.1 DegT/DnrJ/EryC1/StrS family aminotransferase [Gammaproteobacteria bacterium]MBK7727298.1 DegT/DnrJ/EryC1/StrS family aminotransferase [Gammaproteobacteria bacterium]
MRIPAREVRYGGAMIDQKEIDAVVNVMKTGMSVGEQVQTFESRCARLLGKEYGVMVNSGSSALLIAVRLLDLPPGSEIITPTLTFGTDISCIVLNGHVPVLVDVEPDTYQVDIDRIERNITPLTRALLIPSLVGGMPDWDRLRALADKHGLKIIEDSCDTLGGTYRGTPAGDRSDISVTSFSIFHIITCLGNGGLIAINDPQLWDRGLMLRAWGRSSEKFMHGTRKNDSDGRFLENLGDIEYDGLFIFEEIAYGFIPNEAGAAFGHEQLNKLELFTKLRQERFELHDAYMDTRSDIFVKPRVLDEVFTTWICYPVQLRPELGWSRRELQRHLEDSGIFTRVIMSGHTALQPMMNKVKYRVDPEGCPNAERVMRHGLMLPCHPTMTLEDCRYLYQTIDDFIALQRGK